MVNRRSLLAIAAAACAGFSGAARSAPVAALYRARTIVTGQRPETRGPGLATCLRRVLVRVSGDWRLADHPGLDAIAMQTPNPVLRYAYRDLYAGRPIMDEQGTRDRPYELTVDYDPAFIDDLLARLGSRPWLADRPGLMMFLAVRHIGTSYVLSSTVEAGQLQREALADAAWRHSMAVAVPTEETLARAALEIDSLPVAPLARLEALLVDTAAERALAGNLIWSRERQGWIADWRLRHQGVEKRWSIAGVNFDAAFRNAVGGAAMILSGSGDTA